mmetsp:Transcript_26996/g.57808  ORF Transcript_26996/g.57808 Transcript_26996/m.57808 type:complete len:162 (+) Transcript_26996:284-769(+)
MTKRNLEQIAVIRAAPFLIQEGALNGSVHFDTTQREHRSHRMWFGSRSNAVTKQPIPDTTTLPAPKGLLYKDHEALATRFFFPTDSVAAQTNSDLVALPLQIGGKTIERDERASISEDVIVWLLVVAAERSAISGSEWKQVFSFEHHAHSELSRHCRQFPE